MKIKNKILLHLLLISIAVQLTAVLSYAQIGFHAKLDTPPSFVSSYEEVEDKVSVAIYPQTFPILDKWLRYKPRAVSSNFAEGSIRFETQYYGVRREKYYLTPISVDAENYSNFRIQKALMNSLAEGFSNSIVKSDEKKRRSGLGLQVALPKRLEKIFGEGSAGLKISGRRRISFAGRSNWSDDVTTGVQQSKFPSLVMDQVSRFDITGTIGSKITVKVSQDSQTDIPLSNAIQIRYKGDEDDVLKSIEAGNTTLSLPNTKFVGYSSRIRGLFGLKAEAQVGNLRITGIASQEKGSSETTSITAGGEESLEYLRDYEYVERRVFDLVLPSEGIVPSDRVSKIFLYESVPSYNADTITTIANFYVKPDSISAYKSEAVTGNDTKVREIPDTKYQLYHDRDVPYIVFNTPQSRNNTIGLYMEIISENGDTTFFGNLSDTLNVFDTTTTGIDTTNVWRLKLLVPSDALQPSPRDETWQLMWRNCYSIPKGTAIEDIKFKVRQGLEGTERNVGSFLFQGIPPKTDNYLEILGLDLRNSNSDTEIPDEIVDENPFNFRSDWGLIIFPSRTPFDDDTTYSYGSYQLPELEIKVPEIYNYDSWTTKTEASKYFIEMVTTTRGSIIRLNRANIIDGSERITANGDLLVKGQDYDINYDFGQVTLRSEKATDPNSEIKIDFEYAPFFAVQKKSLLGFRAEYEWSKDLKFGSTFLYKSDKAQERKPKVGQETARTVIFDTDLSLKLHPEFLTTMIDALPLIETEAKSNLTISAELAQSHPNPNVNDIAYVDDFESSLDNISLGLFRTNWKHASQPQQLDGKGYLKTKMLWYNPETSPLTTDVYDRDIKVGTGVKQTFRMVFRANQIVYDSEIDEVPNPIDSTSVKTWGGFMRYFGSPLDESRVKLFEVRLKGRRGKIHLDFGAINEDINKNTNADTEDRDASEEIDLAGTEDTGLDKLMDEFEVPAHIDSADIDAYLAANPDPHGDNWYSFRNPEVGKQPLPDSIFNLYVDNFDDSSNIYYYDFLNGTEGNIADGGSARLPDKESYSPGFTTENAYFSYVINLDDEFERDRFKVAGSERIPNIDNAVNNDTPGDSIPWITYRIPIRDPDALDQIVTSDPNIQPAWNKISHVRIWVEGELLDNVSDTIEIADWYFVQPSWKDSVIFSPLSDMKSNFVISAVSSDVDENFHVHKDVEAYEDPTTNVVEVQKALQLSFDNLNRHDTCIAVKNLFTIDQYSGYRRMEMYVHGEGDGAEPGNPDISKIKFFFRLGRDSKNYYEYHTNIVPGWNESNHVNIDFNELTALKDSALQNVEFGEIINVENEKYRVYGRPNINEIKFLAVGVINEDSLKPISGNIWVDELRVTDVRKDVGTAGRVSATGNMADFMNYNFSLESRDPYFRGISAATRGGSSNNLGSGKHRTSSRGSMTFNLHKLLPRSWNASIPVSLSYSKAVETPLLRTNSDIVLPEEIRLEEQRVTESKTVSVSLKFKKKTRNPLFSVLLNRLDSRMSYRRSNLKDANTPYSFGEVVDVNASYNLGIKKVPKIPVFFFLKSVPILKKAASSKLSLYPDTWTMKGSFSRNLSVSDDKAFKRRSSIKRSFNASMKINYKFFDNLATSFDYDTRRDLTNLDLINFSLNKDELKIGLETYYGQRFTLSYDPKLLNFFTTSFSFRSSYSDDWERSNSTRRSNLSRNISIGGKFDHQALFGGKGTTRDRGFKKRRGGRTKNVLADEEKKKDKFYAPVLKGLRKLTGWIDPVSYNYSTSFTNSLPGLLSRPGYSYLFGLTNDAKRESVEDSRNPSSGVGEAYDFSTGFTLLGGIKTTVKYRKSVSSDLRVISSDLNKEVENTSESWPDLNIRIQKFKHLPLIQKYVNKFIDIFSPSTGYSRAVKESIDKVAGFTTSKNTSTNFNPLIKVNFKLFRSLSLTSTVTKNISESITFASLTGKRLQTTKTTKQSFALSTKYSFTSPHGISIPLLGKLKFNSTVDLSLNVKYNSSKIENDKQIGINNTTNDESSIAYNPVIAYTFSRQIKGGITMRWQDTKGRRNQHTREVQLWTEISF